MASSPCSSGQTRRTRIVCISDTHNSTVKLPKGDVLIHAGDLTNQGSYSELSKAVQWLEKADFEAKIVIAGNHDITLDSGFYQEHGHNFHNKTPQDTAECLKLLTSSPTITYLCHGSTKIQLTNPKGPKTEFTVFGSPYSPRNGLWAFGYDDIAMDLGSLATQTSTAPGSQELATANLWTEIPLDTDILVTHTPPQGNCDVTLGCPYLKKRLSTVRPRLHVCGHVHPGRGAERVRWELKSVGHDGDEECHEANVEYWNDPNPDTRSAKLSLVDLTARGGNRALAFGLSAVSTADVAGGIPRDGQLLDPSVSCTPSSRQDSERRIPAGPTVSDGHCRGLGSGSGLGSGPATLDDVQHLTSKDPSRTGRRETCVVNCAIVATNWPHTGGRRYNKPIVVDLDLPVWVQSQDQVEPPPTSNRADNIP
ncbi:Metallo-dependent phosphatase-like protein [Cercophora samala]|uniref:Metallo-dependent phosphatase-like protein n=1 Tax=Cercophora samala TaxID=330535 RepID=A0AA39ZB88_9PEZI|nr:Metallo-dependent phosphatase-like protein [Cercophora samala]